jgi:hypothetical protein
MNDFAAIVMRDERLAERLAAIDSSAAFISEVIRSAHELGVVLSEASLRHAGQPDPLGLTRWTAPAFMASAVPPRAWLPIAAVAEQNAISIDWAWFGPEPLRAPFYEDDIRRALRLPFNRAFRYRTSLAGLVEGTRATESLAPDGFIFHMSRCGSTLVAQMLAALDGAIVISEAPPIDSILQYGRGADIAAATEALRAMVLAFGRKRAGAERRYFIKLDCWHTLALPIFRRAFPDVPWLFLYRDPVEVLVSQMRQRGMQMVPQFLPPSFYGLDAAESTMDENYCARVLAAVCRAALKHSGLGGGLMVNYRDLAEAVFTAALPHFGISCTRTERDRMLQVTLTDAKAPGLPFAADAATKRRAATDAIRHAAADNLDEIYARLEGLAECGMRY